MGHHCVCSAQRLPAQRALWCFTAECMIELADGAPWMPALQLLDLSDNADLFRAGHSGTIVASRAAPSSFRRHQNNHMYGVFV